VAAKWVACLGGHRDRLCKCLGGHRDRLCKCLGAASINHRFTEAVALGRPSPHIDFRRHNVPIRTSNRQSLHVLNDPTREK
jgi:hypothetical protein